MVQNNNRRLGLRYKTQGVNIKGGFARVLTTIRYSFALSALVISFTGKPS